MKILYTLLSVRWYDMILKKIRNKNKNSKRKKGMDRKKQKHVIEKLKEQKEWKDKKERMERRKEKELALDQRSFSTTFSINGLLK